jgi:hypothetical protein
MGHVFVVHVVMCSHFGLGGCVGVGVWVWVCGRVGRWVGGSAGRWVGGSVGWLSCSWAGGRLTRIERRSVAISAQAITVQLTLFNRPHFLCFRFATPPMTTKNVARMTGH